VGVRQDTTIARPWVIVVGGFLGSGKTTLLLAAAQQLESRGLRSALILNDQGESLVDTEYAALHGLEHGEVTGGCFCCRFSDLIEVMGQLCEHSPDVIFAEPVGSCADISATTLRPLLEYNESYRLAPFTVLADLERARELLRDDADPSLSFLFRSQLQEADLVCFTKADITPDYPAIDARQVRQVSAKTGQGVAAWLDEMMSGSLSAGGEILTIDYEKYARAEAALAWLNLEVVVEPEEALSGAVILGPLLDKLDADFTAAGISIVHLKAIINSHEGYLKAAICANGQSPIVEGALVASPASRHHLLLNLRALGTATHVRAIVEEKVCKIGGLLTGLRVSCFHPAPPKPERRIPRIQNLGI
jgi:Ni2+-binding GTPase involved in maturation of urease and hydrogenase